MSAFNLIFIIGNSQSCGENLFYYCFCFHWYCSKHFHSLHPQILFLYVLAVIYTFNQRQLMKIRTYKILVVVETASYLFRHNVIVSSFSLYRQVFKYFTHIFTVGLICFSPLSSGLWYFRIIKQRLVKQ